MTLPTSSTFCRASDAVVRLLTYELNNLFKNNLDVKIDLRYIDDGFIIVKTPKIVSINEWCDNVFKHEYLTFTYETSDKEISYLDVLVKICDKNIIITSLYSKPMAKNLFLHYNSNHPKTLIHSLPYCQFLRIKRLCSTAADYEYHEKEMYHKFLKRGYPSKLLDEVRHKIQTMNRTEIMRPKTNLICKSLSHNHPNILLKYPINIPRKAENEDSVYIVMPFYKNMYNFKDMLLKFIHAENEKGLQSDYNKTITELRYIVSFKKINELGNFCKPTNQPTNPNSV
jgi:hypothetical protein